MLIVLSPVAVIVKEKSHDELKVIFSNITVEESHDTSCADVF